MVQNPNSSRWLLQRTPALTPALRVCVTTHRTCSRVGFPRPTTPGPFNCWTTFDCPTRPVFRYEHSSLASHVHAQQSLAQHQAKVSWGTGCHSPLQGPKPCQKRQWQHWRQTCWSLQTHLLGSSPSKADPNKDLMLRRSCEIEGMCFNASQLGAGPSKPRRAEHEL